MIWKVYVIQSVIIFNFDNKTRHLRFESMERLNSMGLQPDINNYKCVYCAPLADDMTLDKIFYILNMERPSDFLGHSLSISDVIVLQRNGTKTAYYIDTFSFKELPTFIAQA